MSSPDLGRHRPGGRQPGAVAVAHTLRELLNKSRARRASSCRDSMAGSSAGSARRADSHRSRSAWRHAGLLAISTCSKPAWVRSRQAGACLAGNLQAVPAASAAQIDQQLSRRQVQRRGTSAAPARAAGRSRPCATAAPAPAGQSGRGARTGPSGHTTDRTHRHFTTCATWSHTRAAHRPCSLGRPETRPRGASRPAGCSSLMPREQ
jgi:hypothetical protein